MNFKHMINLKEKFSEQYTITIDSDMKGVNVHMTSIAQLRWDFSVLDINDNELEIRLVLLDHILLKANNPLVKEIAQFTQVFNRMYNELHLKIDNQGKILKVLNMDLILSKWRQTKEELEVIAENTPDIKKAIILNDNIFQDQKRLIEGIQGNEFFLLYFNKIYGRNIEKSYTQFGLNFFNTANVEWKYKMADIYNPKLSYDEKIIEIYGEPAFFSMDNIGFSNRAYQQFANLINVKKLTPVLKEKGIYRVNSKTGRFIEASLTREEIADSEKLYTKMKYTLYNDEMLKYKLANENTTASK